MGQIITKVHVKCDIERGEDVHYNKLTIVFDGTEDDLLATINKFLRGQIQKGLLKTNRLRDIEITDETEEQDGIFGHNIAQIKEWLFE